MNPIAFRFSLVMLVVLACSACAGTPANKSAASNSPVKPSSPALSAEQQRQDEQYGLHFVSLRTNGDGLLLDLRVRVSDPEKAKPYLNRSTHPKITDVASKQELQVPHAENVGSLRSMGGKLIRGRVYPMLFANPGRLIKPGSKVNIELGHLQLTDVIVE